jgi:hypothetical protein
MRDAQVAGPLAEKNSEGNLENKEAIQEAIQEENQEELLEVIHVETKEVNREATFMAAQET